MAEQYKIELGVKLRDGAIQNEINEAQKTLKPIELKVDAETKELTNTIREALNSLSKGTKNALKIDTSEIRKSLDGLSSIVDEIKRSLGTLDSGDMKSLVSSINQMVTALGKAENESDSLVKSLSALSKKDFSINVGIDMNKKNLNTIGYGRAARKQVIPELEAQIKYLENLFGGQQATMNKLASQGKNVGFDIFTDFGDFNSDSAIKKMEAMEKYINSLKKLATIDNVNLDGFNEIHKDASALINDITGIENAVDKAGDVPEKLKNLFGSGIDGEGLSKQLDSIVVDLGEIKTVIQGISSGVSLEGLTQSFDRLSNSIEQLVKNCTTAKQAINDSIGNVGKSVGQGSGEAEIKKTSNELAKLKKLAHQIGQLNFKIVKADYNDEIKQVKEFERQLDLLKIQYNETINSLNANGIDINSEDITKEFVDARAKIAEFEAKVADTKRKLSEDIKSNIGTSIAKDINKAHSDFDKLSVKTIELQQKMDLIDNIKIDLDTAAANNDIDGLITASDNLQRALKDINAQIDISNRAQKNALGSANLDLKKQAVSLDIDNYLNNNTRAAKAFGDELRRLQREINACDDSGAFKILEQQVRNVKKEAAGLTKGTQTFGDKFKKQWQQYSSYFSVASIFQYAQQGLRSMFEQVKLIDSAMTELKKVTNETDEAYNKFLKNAATRSREIGTTIDGLVSSTADFARLGYGFEDAQGLAEVANIYAVVGDEIEGVEGATESLISTMAAFKDEMNGMSNTDFAMSIIDKFNEIGNNFAISSGGIGEALERSASSLMAANNTIDESIALITAANTVVQDPEQVGRLMPTKKVAISVKLQRWTRPRKDFVL